MGKSSTFSTLCAFPQVNRVDVQVEKRCGQSWPTPHRLRPAWQV
ncbi:hypothetical protein [Frankia sp. CiP3]|nr:hypothetical protein [Frankia sp. CiP3]